jgi:hypothetical protein
MRKSPESNALVPVTQSLPAAQVDMAAIDWDAHDKKLRDGLETAYRQQRNAGALARVSVAGMCGMNLAFVIPVPFLLPLAAVPVFYLYGIGAYEQKKVNNLVPEAVERAVGQMREEFRKAQVAVYNDQKRLVAEAAERHLAAGNLLGIEDAAWLGNLDPETLKDATHQLAITVLQIRLMLAHQRCTAFNSDGSRKAAKPFTFASEKLAPDYEKHRHHLRRELAALDRGLAEDKLPVIQEMELAEEIAPRTGYWKGLKDFINPFFARRMKREFTQAQLPRFKDIEVPALQPVADFSAALEAYEAQNPPLDLPAVRGWHGGRRKALPGPKAMR